VLFLYKVVRYHRGRVAGI